MKKKPKPKGHQQFKIKLQDMAAVAIAANRARIAEQERLVRAGLLRPVELGLGNAATQAGDALEDYLEGEGDWHGGEPMF